MTIGSAISRNQYTASSGQTVFPYTFKVFDDDDITVTVADTNGAESVKTLTTDYSVSDVGDENGGNITFVTGVTLNYIVTITRKEPLTQQVGYTPGDKFPAASHEEGLDRSCIRDQYLSEQIERCLKYTVGSNISAVTTELNLSDFKGKLLLFDSSTGEPTGVSYTGLLAGIAGTTSTHTQSITATGVAAYTLNFTPANANRILVFVNGALQIAGDSYTLSGTTLTFTATITSGDEIYVIDLSGTELELVVPNGHITTARLADDAVTLAKIQNISTDKVLGRTTASTGIVEELSLLDEDNMASNSDTSLATQQSIKAYVDSSVATGLLQYSGTQVFSGSMPTSYADLDLSATIGANRALVNLVFVPDVLCSIQVRTNGVTKTQGYNNGTAWGGGVTLGSVSSGNELHLSVMTDSSGIIEWDSDSAGSGGTTVTLESYTLL